MGPLGTSGEKDRQHVIIYISRSLSPPLTPYLAWSVAGCKDILPDARKACED